MSVVRQRNVLTAERVTTVLGRIAVIALVLDIMGLTVMMVRYVHMEQKLKSAFCTDEIFFEKSTFP